MKKFLKHLPSIIFNIAEVLIVILIGVLLGLTIQRMIVLMLLFGIVRMNFKKAMHYKDWRRCLVMTSLFFLSLFVVAKCDFLLSLLLVIFESTILTGKGDINDIFQWKGNKLNQEVFDWVKFNLENKKLLEYEEHLKEHDNRKYIIFQYRFRELKKFDEIADLMGLPTQRISDELNIISHFIEYSIRLDN